MVESEPKTKLTIIDPIRKLVFAPLSNPLDLTLSIPEMPLKTADKVIPEWVRFCWKFYSN
jgi:hypothetical protein